jgi:Domain of unknown function (DUF1996)/GDSL-like Lipase/Acylhydrolase family
MRSVLGALAFLAVASSAVAQGVPSLPSNFDVKAWIAPGDKGLNIDRNSDPVGAFRFLCHASHNAYDDPIVYPGKPGASHLHTFFGNTKANAHSTYESLRKEGNGTCDGGPLNRSAYWVPAMMNGKGQVVMPDYITVYYKALPGTRDLPRGLRMLFGHDMATGAFADPYGPKSVWVCQGAASETIPANCPPGQQITGRLNTPDCWDGKNLDSPNHRSHMAYSTQWSKQVCPPSHPVRLPQFSIAAFYTTDADLPRWHLSSDRMPGMAPRAPGTTFHSDWFGAWDDPTMAAWMANCINKKLSCVAGELGDGRQLKRPATFKWAANPRLVNAPAIPGVEPTSPAEKPTMSIVIFDGDSQSVLWGGDHVALFRNANPSLDVRSLAAGGSRIQELEVRQAQIIAAKPAMVVVMIGANDLTWWDFAGASVWAERVLAYMDKFRAAGIKTALHTVLPRTDALHNTRRKEVNAIFRAAVPGRIDAVVDAAANPAIGDDDDAASRVYYKDGLHLTDAPADPGGVVELSRIEGPVLLNVLSGAVAPPPPPPPPPTEPVHSHTDALAVIDNMAKEIEQLRLLLK